METLFTTAIATRFSGEYEVPAPKLGPAAKLVLKPATLQVLRAVAHTYSLCKRCLGFGVISVGEGEWQKEQTCPKCKGVGEMTMSDPDPRREVLKKVLVRWSGVLAQCPTTGKIVPLELTDDVRAGIPHTDGYDYILKLARELVTRAEEEGKAPSSPPPAPASDTEVFAEDGEKD